MKKNLGLLLAFVMAATMILSGCSGNAVTPSPSSTTNAPTAQAPTAAPAPEATAAAEKVEIRVSWWGDTTRHELYNKICDAFEAENADVKLLREPASWSDYWDKLTVQSAGDGAPDFMGMHPQYANDFIRRGVIEPLDSYVNDGTIDLSKFNQGVIDSGVVDGVNYMIPMGVTLQAILVNNTGLEELGVTVPGFDWTWDDVKTIGLEARAALDAAGQQDAWLMNDASGVFQMFRYWARQRGGDNYTADGNIGFTAEDAATWFAMWKDLLDNGIVPDAATSTEYAKATLEENLFTTGRTYITTIPANQYKLYSIATPERDLSLIRNPSMVDGKVGEFPEGAHFAISAKTTPEKKAAAARFLNFWVNTESAMSLFGLDQGVPGNTDMAEFIKPGLDGYQLKIMDYVNKTAAIATATTFPPTGASEISALFESTAEKVRFGAITPEQAGAELVEQAQAIVDANN